VGAPGDGVGASSGGGRQSGDESPHSKRTGRIANSGARLHHTRMNAQQFIAKWRRSNLSELSAYQQHFLDLCDLFAQPKPADADPDGTQYTFQRGSLRRKPLAA
jgi:hypothetical protein